MAFACDICRTLSLAPALATGHPGWVAWSMRAPIQRIFGADMKVSIVIAPASVPRPTRTIFLAAKLNAALWIAKTVAECGSGDLFQTMNKGASDDDLGFTLQSGLVTKALVGLFGSNRFRLAVSVDGSTVFDGLSVDNATGIIDQPRLPPFKAYTNYDNYVGVGSWTKIGINNTDYNDQGAFDAANNRIVAPIDGTSRSALSKTSSSSPRTITAVTVAARSHSTVSTSPTDRPSRACRLAGHLMVCPAGIPGRARSRSPHSRASCAVG